MTRYVKTSFILRNMAILSMIVLCACFVTYMVLYSMLSKELATNFRAAFYQLKSTYDALNMVVLLGVTLYSIITWTFILAVSLFATHKVAGPLYRLELAIGDGKKGVLRTDLKFREGDQIAPLAEAKNGLFVHLKEKEDRFAALRERLSGLRGSIHEYASTDTSQWKDTQSELREIVGEIKAPYQSSP